MYIVLKIKFIKIFIVIIIIILILSCTSALAHPGGLDSNGGHYNRKTGEYHYHNKDKAATADKPAQAKAQEVEVYFQPNELDEVILKVLMYLYVYIYFFYILCSLYNSIDSRYLKYIFPPVSLFLLICAYSMAEDSNRAKAYLLIIWGVAGAVISYGIYSVEKQIKALKNSDLVLRYTDNTQSK